MEARGCPKPGAEILWHWLMVESGPPGSRPDPRWTREALAVLSRCLDAYASRDGAEPEDDPRLCRLAIAAHDLRQEARAAAGALIEEVADLPVEDPRDAEEALFLLPPLEDADLFLAALLLLWAESDRWLARPREERRVHGARRIVEWLDRRLPPGPSDGGRLLAPELVAQALRRIQEALPGLDLSSLLARLPEVQELLAAEAAPEGDAVDDPVPAGTAAPVPVPLPPGAVAAVERLLKDLELLKPRGEWWTSQHLGGIVLQILGLPPPVRARLFERSLAVAGAFAGDAQGWWTSRVLVDAVRSLAHLPGAVEPLFAALDRTRETVRHDPYQFDVLEETAVALAAQGGEAAARSCLERIADDHQQAGAACRAARALATAGQPAAAERLFRLALDSARRATAAGKPSREAEVLRALAACGRPAAARLASLCFPDGPRRARAFSEVAAALLDRAAPAEAFRCLLHLLTSPRLSPVPDSDALGRIARGLAAGGRAPRARKLLASALAAAAALPDPEAQEQHLKTLSAAALTPEILGGTTALLKTAVKTARAVEVPWRRDNLLEHLAGSLVGAGKSDAALALEDAFSRRGGKARLLARVAEAAISAGDLRRGAGLLDRALDHLEGHRPDASDIPFQSAFVPALFALPDPGLRRPLLRRALDQVAACESDTQRACALLHLGRRIAEADRDGSHGDLLARTAVRIEKAEMPSEAAALRKDVARLRAEAGDRRPALEALLAETGAEQRADAEKRADAAATLAPLLPAGPAPRLEESLAVLEDEMYRVKTREGRANVLARLVEAWTARGDPRRALAVLDRADAGEMGAEALAALCRGAAPADLAPFAGTLRELLADFDEPRERAGGLVELARVLARSARQDEALRALADAAAALCGIDDRLGRHIALEKVAECLDEEALAAPWELYRTLLTAGCRPPAWNPVAAVAAVGRALARQPAWDPGLRPALEETLASSPVRRRFVQAWRAALLAVHPSPRSVLRRTLSLFPLEPGLAVEGVQCLAAAHLQAGDTAAFEAIVRACPGVLSGEPARALPG